MTIVVVMMLLMMVVVLVVMVTMMTVVMEMGGQIQNKIDLREVLWARETEQTPQTPVFTKTAEHKIFPTSLRSILHGHNQVVVVARWWWWLGRFGL